MIHNFESTIQSQPQKSKVSYFGSRANLSHKQLSIKSRKKILASSYFWWVKVNLKTLPPTDTFQSPHQQCITIVC